MRGSGRFCPGHGGFKPQQSGIMGVRVRYREVYDIGKAALAAASVPEAETDARLLLEFVCAADRNTLLAHGDREVTREQEGRYRELVEERSRRIPLQHLTGEQDFMGLRFAVNGHVLIPRQDTEILVEEAMRYLHDGMRILDMCTGSGCILISLLHYSNNCQGVGADISGEALEVAEENAGRLLGSGNLQMPNVQAPHVQMLHMGRPEGTEPSDERRISFVQSDLFEKVEGMFDMIVSNPPYIRSGVIGTLMPEVREHEPKLSLDGGGDGLLFYRRILEACPRHLKKGGMLFFEIGYDQGEAVSRMMEQAGFLEVKVVKDYGGMDRVAWGTFPFGWSGERI